MNYSYFIKDQKERKGTQRSNSKFHKECSWKLQINLRFLFWEHEKSQVQRVQRADQTKQVIFFLLLLLFVLLQVLITST